MLNASSGPSRLFEYVAWSTAWRSCLLSVSQLRSLQVIELPHSQLWLQPKSGPHFTHLWKSYGEFREELSIQTKSAGQLHEGSRHFVPYFSLHVLAPAWGVIFQSWRWAIFRSFKVIAWIYITFGSFAALTGLGYVLAASHNGAGNPTGALVQVALSICLVIASIFFLKKSARALLALKILTAVTIVFLVYTSATSEFISIPASMFGLIFYIAPLAVIMLKLCSSSAKLFVSIGTLMAPPICGLMEPL